MSGRPAKSRQEPLGPDEGFTQLMARLISANRAERAQREKASRAGPTMHRSDHETSAIPDSLRA
jgi:hypothetical protein